MDKGFIIFITTVALLCWLESLRLVENADLWEEKMDWSVKKSTNF